LTERGLESFGFFEFTPMGIVVLLSGVIYMVLLGRRFLPVREGAHAKEDIVKLRDYVTEVKVSADSQLSGKTLYESRLGQEYDLNVLAIRRESGQQALVSRETQVQSGDLLIVESSASDLVAATRELGLSIAVDYELDLMSLEPGDMQVIEVTVAPNSHVVGHSLNETRFRDQYGFTVLAISSQGKVLTERLRDIPLHFGDALLLQGPQHRIVGLQEGTDFLVLEPDERESFRLNRAPLAVGALLLAIGLSMFTDVGIALAMVLAAVSMILSGVLTIEEAYESVDWRTVFLVAGMLPLGLAMEETGTATFLADHMLRIFGPYGPLATLAGIYLLAAIITQPMSNAAAIVLITPIALDTAAGLGANYKTFTMAVVIGAATSFLSPVGHKANVLVFGPGGYKFTDYARVGALLTVLLLIMAMIFLPIIWPLFPD